MTLHAKKMRGSATTPHPVMQLEAFESLFPIQVSHPRSHHPLLVLINDSGVVGSRRIAIYKISNKLQVNDEEKMYLFTLMH